MRFQTAYSAVNSTFLPTAEQTIIVSMKPSFVLSSHTARIRDLTSRHNVVNLRIFGSVLHGTDEEGSDLDLLVDPLPGTTLFDLGGLQAALEDLLGVPVDVVTPCDLPVRIRAQVVAEARPL